MNRPGPMTGFCLMALALALSPVGAQTPSPPPAPDDEAKALRNAFESASGNPQLVMQNLDRFLTRFPRSPRRAQVLRTILQEGVQNNNPEKAMEAAGNLLELDPANTQLLSTFVELLDHQADASGRQQALRHATRLVERAESVAQQAKPPSETQSIVLASSYLARGKIYEKSGEDAKALGDFEKSYAAYPTAEVAERLGDLEAKQGDLSRAIDRYVRAFAFPEYQDNSEQHSELRKKLGKAYVTKFRSEKGLGDLILARYDELTRTLRPRLQARSAPNARSLDPFEYVLPRLDGSEMRFKEVLGKVVVMDFWATWCAPCRLEGRLLEHVRRTFRQAPDAVFLAVDTDENRSGVPAFVKEEEWTLPVVYAGGIDRLLGVHALPTLLIFDPKGRVVFRAEGLDPSSFEQTVEKKLREALAGR